MKTVVVNGPTATVDGRKVIHLCSNDYLGLSQNKQVIKKTRESLQEISQCSSRLIAGNHPVITTVWVNLGVTWCTQNFRNLNKNDFIMAAKTDAIYKNYQQS